MSVPCENLNIAFIGEVSTGKSTLLNGIFCNELSQTSIKRTTMFPIVFVENKELEYDNIHIKSVFEEIKDKNIDIIKSTEQGNNIEICEELVFNVSNLDLKILDNHNVNVYDIPGLNDARTKTIYYDYLKNNFHKFNIVILIIDINSGLNTSDEMDILRLITENTKLQKELNNKDIYTIVIVNKADDMQIKIDDKNGKEILYLSDELNEMFQQVTITVTDEYNKLNIFNHLIDILPLCGLDAYLYRMINKHGKSYHLKDSEILKIGINEMGKKFSKKSKEEQRNDVMSIIQNKNFVNDMIKLSGFEGFEKSLYNFLNKNDMVKKLIISNILYETKDLNDLNNIFLKNNDNVEKIKKHVDRYMSYLSKIILLNEDLYYSNVSTFFNNLLDQLRIIINLFTDIDSIKIYYDYFYDNIIDNYFSIVKESEKYPPFVKEKMINILKDKFSYNKINISDFIQSIKCLLEVDINDNIENLLNIIIKNINSKNTFIFNKDNDELVDLTLVLNSLFEKYLVDNLFIEKFLRFLLMNYYEHINDNIEELLYKELLFIENSEIIMSKYLSLKTINSSSKIEFSDIFLDRSTYRENVKFDMDILENFYLEWALC